VHVIYLPDATKKKPKKKTRQME